MRQVLSLLTLTVFAATSLLGHGGMHAIVGASGCGEHLHAHVDAPHHSHGTHSHCHHHVETDDSDSPQELPPAHDHDECLICQWYAEHNASMTLPVVLSAYAPCVEQLQVERSLIADEMNLMVRSRGPPTC